MRCVVRLFVTEEERLAQLSAGWETAEVEEHADYDEHHKVEEVPGAQEDHDAGKSGKVARDELNLLLPKSGVRKRINAPCGLRERGLLAAEQRREQVPEQDTEGAAEKNHHEQQGSGDLHQSAVVLEQVRLNQNAGNHVEQWDGHGKAPALVQGAKDHHEGFLPRHVLQ